jgi:hypothetical protein
MLYLSNLREYQDERGEQDSGNDLDTERSAPLAVISGTESYLVLLVSVMPRVRVRAKVT